MSNTGAQIVKRTFYKPVAAVEDMQKEEVDGIVRKNILERPGHRHRHRHRHRHQGEAILTVFPWDIRLREDEGGEG